MKPWVLSAAICLALIATPLWAQRGGGGGHGGFGGAGHGSVAGAAHSSGFSGYHGGGYAHSGYGGWHNGWNGGWHGYGWRGYGYRNRYGYYPWWGYGYGGWGWYPSWGWYGDFDYDSYNNYPSDYGPDQYGDGQPSLGYVYMTPQSSTATYADPGEVQRIQQEVNQLKAQQAKRDQATESPQGQTGTVLVYRDGYTETINNYAIVGDTVWVLNPSSAKKVPLSELDLTATKRDNEERGTDFVVPKSSH